MGQSTLAQSGQSPCSTACSTADTPDGNHIPLNNDPRRVPDHACAYNLVAFSYRDRFPRQPTDAEILAGRAPTLRLLRELFALTGD